MPSISASPRILAIILLASLLAACERHDAPETRRLAALGTLVTLNFYGIDATTADRVTGLVEKRLRERGRDWYPWADGELAALNNALAEGRPYSPDAALAELLQRATQLEAQSNGRFNAGIGALTMLWRFHEPLAEHWHPPADAEVQVLAARQHGLRQLRWDGRQVSGPPLIVDPGGIAKGALLMELRELISAAGVRNAIIDLGGDLLVLGETPAGRARIGIRDPAGGAALAWLEAAAGEAVFTSGNYERYFEFDGLRYAHVLDPATGRPAATSASVTVVHADPVLADAAATALLVGGPDEFETLCAALRIELALLIEAGGRRHLTPAMAERLHWLDDSD